PADGRQCGTRALDSAEDFRKTLGRVPHGPTSICSLLSSPPNKADKRYNILPLVRLVTAFKPGCDMPPTLLTVGQPAPWFVARCTTMPDFQFHSAAGRYVVLCFFRSAADPTSQRVLAELQQFRQVFDDSTVCFFGVSTDPDDERLPRVRGSVPGIRFF